MCFELVLPIFIHQTASLKKIAPPPSAGAVAGNAIGVSGAKALSRALVKNRFLYRLALSDVHLPATQSIPSPNWKQIVGDPMGGGGGGSRSEPAPPPSAGGLGWERRQSRGGVGGPPSDHPSPGVEVFGSVCFCGAYVVG